MYLILMLLGWSSFFSRGTIYNLQVFGNKMCIFVMALKIILDDCSIQKDRLQNDI
jgi:hypothetical protein